MLVAFEGQDGAGKTALLEAAHAGLQRRGIASVALEEFSDSPYGQQLVRAVARDKFLRPAANETATPITRVLEEVADLYYFDERIIGPALARGQVVLKDRHRDTIVYTLVPTLVDSGAIVGEERALNWLAALCGELRHPPDLTVYAWAPLGIRLDRIAKRRRDLAEDRAHEVSDQDRAVFAARERIVARLINEEPTRFLPVDNGKRPVEKGAKEVIEAIHKWQVRTENTL
jgi:thymidylate kinase